MSEEDSIWNQLAALAVTCSDNVHEIREVRADSHLADDLGLSSLMAVNLVMDLESEFDIIIQEEDFDHIQTVGDLKRVIMLRQGTTTT